MSWPKKVKEQLDGLLLLLVSSSNIVSLRFKKVFSKTRKYIIPNDKKKGSWTI